MKAAEIPLLLVKYKSKIDEKVPRYHAILERWYPEKMKSPLERFKASSWYFNDKTEAENLKTFNDIKELGGSIAEKFTDKKKLQQIKDIREKIAKSYLGEILSDQINCRVRRLVRKIKDSKLKEV